MNQGAYLAAVAAACVLIGCGSDTNIIDVGADASGGTGGVGGSSGSAGQSGSGGSTGGTGGTGATGGSSGAAGAAGMGGAAGTGGGATTVRFAVIGDYGNDSSAEGEVATLVKSWNPRFVITTGDNNYTTGSAATIDRNIGKYYQEFIGNYTGTYGPGSNTNRFWPSPGNHDWETPNLTPYTDYFTLPGNERYYDVDLGLVHLFSVDSDSREPDGTSANSVQGQWLQTRLSQSTACWKIVYFHHPPYSSGQHGSSTGMRWPFDTWGADAVFTGHDHTYERLEVSGFPYFVVGFSGQSLYQFNNVIPQSQARYNGMHGAARVTATDSLLRVQAFSTDGQVRDTFTLNKSCP